jgi:hypothetical protein
MFDFCMPSRVGWRISPVGTLTASHCWKRSAPRLLSSSLSRFSMQQSRLISRALPLAVALPRMLEKIEAELANEKPEAAKEQGLRRRAELIRGLLTPSRIT